MEKASSLPTNVAVFAKNQASHRFIGVHFRWSFGFADQRNRDQCYTILDQFDGQIEPITTAAECGRLAKIIIANMIDRAPEMTSIKRKGRSSSLKAKTPEKRYLRSS